MRTEIFHVFFRCFDFPNRGFNQDTRQGNFTIEITESFLPAYTRNVRLTWPVKYPTGWLLPPLPST